MRVGSIQCVYRPQNHIKRPKIYIPPITSNARVVRNQDDFLILGFYSALDRFLDRVYKAVLSIIGIIVLYWIIS